MASRKEEKERLRKEREERERQEKEASDKQRRRLRLLGIVGAVVVVGIVAALVVSGGGKKSGPEQASQGLQVTPGPWEPVTSGLQDREKALNLPAPSDTIYHVHSQLKVFANGKEMTVPQNIGIDQGQGFLSSLHTHDDKGIIHQEAVEPYPFTLGQFFTVWGVKFTPTQLGSYTVGNGLVLETYVNGEKVPNGPAYEMKQGDSIVVGFGKPGSFEKKFRPDPSVTQ
jgi:hypothetical protein